MYRKGHKFLAKQVTHTRKTSKSRNYSYKILLEYKSTCLLTYRVSGGINLHFNLISQIEGWYFFQKPKLFWILSSENLCCDPSIWLKVTSLSSTASKRKGLNVSNVKIFSKKNFNVLGSFMPFYEK